MRISAKADYAMRAAVELAAAENPPLKRDQIASAQGIPVKFLETILGELKHAGIVASQRGADGGYSLARPPEEVTLADVLRVMEGPLASVRDQRPESISYAGAAEMLQEVWVALRSNMRAVLERVTLADVVQHDLPAEVTALAADPEAWHPHPRP
jgi:Rrf2 family protein